MSDAQFMRLALRLARRGYGSTSPNPMVGAVLVKRGKVIGRGWHRQAGEPHAEIEALADARKTGHSPRGATLFEPWNHAARTGAPRPARMPLLPPASSEWSSAPRIQILG